MPTPPVNRTPLDLERRILRAIDEGMSERDAARAFGRDRKTIQSIKKRRQFEPWLDIEVQGSKVSLPFFSQQSAQGTGDLGYFAPWLVA
jgi:hypothetical protein